MQKIKIYTSKALARQLGVTDQRVRELLVEYRNGKIKDIRGYRVFGGGHTPWYGYDPRQVEIEVVRE